MTANKSPHSQPFPFPNLGSFLPDYDLKQFVNDLKKKKNEKKTKT